MSSCEKCWRDSRYDLSSTAYHDMLAKRDGIRERKCTPEEQAGPEATECQRCGRKTIHQITREPMCGCKEVLP